MERLGKYISDVKDGTIPACHFVKLSITRFENDLLREDLIFLPEKAQKVIDFIAILKHTVGKFDDKPFILSPFQVFIVANLYGFYNLDGSRRFTSAYIELARKSGKALSLDTKIPTPDGWSTMGELQIGDIILDEAGNPTNVTFVTPTQYNRNCYEVEFEDGEKVIADENHQWSVITKTSKRTWDRHSAKPLHKYKEFRDGGFHVLQTKDMINDYVLERKDGKGNEYKYRVSNNKPLELPEKNLILDPYILGCWLGDGTSKEPKFTVHKDDLHMYDSFSKELGREGKITEDKRNGVLTLSFAGDKGQNNSTLRHKLMQLNLLDNKHIPEEYLRASKQQRLSLLQGLMDTDGTCSTSGECEFTQKSEIISFKFCELLGSLGIKHTITEKTATCNGKDCGIVYRIRFFTDKTFSCFKLQRKHNRLKDNLNDRMLNKSIIKITPINSVPVKCITVDSPNSLYLFGEHFTVTHNTAFVAALGLYALCADGEKGAEVIMAANKRDQAKVCFDMASNFITKLDRKNKYFKPFRNEIRFSSTKSIMKVISADGKTTNNDGFNASFACQDEYHAAKSSATRDVIQSSMGMRDNPLLITITTAGFNKILPCFQLRKTNTEVLEGVKSDDSAFTIIFTMDENDDWQDENLWEKSNPNLGVTVTKKWLREQVVKAKNNPGEEVGVITKSFNVWCDAATVWIPSQLITENSRKLNISDFTNLQCYIGADLAITDDLTALAISFLKEGVIYSFTKFFLPEDSLKTKPDKEIYKQWVREGYLIVTPGNQTDYDYITKEILEIAKISKIKKIAYDDYNSTQWAADATKRRLPLEAFPQNLGTFNGPTREVFGLIMGKKIVLDDNPILKWNFMNVNLRTDVNGNIKPDKLKSAGKIDGVIALIQSIAVLIEESTKPKSKIT